MQKNRTNAPETTDRLPRDAVFSILSNRRRRFLVRYLRGCHGPVDRQELARELAMRENDVSRSELSYQQRKRVYTSLHQTHLPKLDDAGLVRYDRDEGVVEATDRLEDLTPYLSAAERRRRPWSAAYLAIACSGAAFVGCAWLAVPPFHRLPGLAYAATVVAALALTAAVHARRDRALARWIEGIAERVRATAPGVPAFADESADRPEAEE